ncbi:MAG: hypothetical protein LUD72_06260, partial [Bacteroidales bacterium]|nr:hypothetical protein [Bacteroidales bacterium]
PNKFFDEETTISVTIRYADTATMLDNVMNRIGGEHCIDTDKRTMNLVLYGNDCIIYKTQIEDIYNALVVLQCDDNTICTSSSYVDTNNIMYSDDIVAVCDRYEQDELVLRYLKDYIWYNKPGLDFVDDLKSEIERLQNEEQTECVVDYIKSLETRLRRFIFLKADAEEFVFRGFNREFPLISEEEMRWLTKKKNWRWSSDEWDFVYERLPIKKKFIAYGSLLAVKSRDILQKLYTVAKEIYKNYVPETISDIVSKRVFDIDWAIEDNPFTVRFYVYEIDDKNFVNDSDVRRVVEGLRYQDHYVGNTLSLTVIIINNTVYDFFRTFDAEGAVATMISFFNTI